ncbi:MAG: HlyD family efflux transporter periplasmic adaptor subunit [Terrimicrobiaceae bacterium]
MGENRQANIQQQLRAMRRMLVWIFVLSGVLLAGLLFFVSVDERVIAEGIVRADRDTHLYAPEDGVLKDVEAWEGTDVAKGDIVVAMDDTEHRAELRQIEANIEKARSEWEFQKLRLEHTAKLPLPKEFWHMHEELDIVLERIRQSTVEYDRARELQRKGLISQQEVERARLSLEIEKAEEAKTRDKLRVVEQGLEEAIISEAGAEIQTALSALRALQVDREIRLQNIGRCLVRSPGDGVVTMLNKRRPGERVQRGEDLAHIAHGGPTRVDIFAGEEQYHRLRPDQRVLMKSLSFDTLRHGYIEGHVVSVSMEPEQSASTEASVTAPSYRVIVKIDHTPQNLVIGSTVEARIIIQRIPLWKLLLPETLRQP